MKVRGEYARGWLEAQEVEIAYVKTERITYGSRCNDKIIKWGRIPWIGTSVTGKNKIPNILCE
jgi:hypothetical protein